MARPLRIEFPGALYHVTSRGDNKCTIFNSDKDREKFLSIYSEVSTRLQWITYAWCLMGNHFHLVVETPGPNLSEGMRVLNGTYTQYVNRFHGRSGHLFQGRFHSILIDRNAYFLEVIRYVVLNPVRAGLATSAQDWPWSSFRAMVGLETPPEWLGLEFTLDAVSNCSGTREQQQVSFASYVANGMRDSRSPMENLKQQIYLGDDLFVAQAQEKILSDASLSGIVREQKRPPLEFLEDFDRTYPDRKEAMARAYLSGQFSQAEIARFYGVHTSSVSKAVRSFRQNGIHTVKFKL